MADGDASYSAAQVEQLLKCPICLDRYRHPKHLPCQHTICKTPCLTGLLATSPYRLQCPQCRTQHQVPPGGVDAFPDNIIINNLLDLPRTQPTAAFKCSNCPRTENLSLCPHCQKQYCAECRPQHLTTIKGEVQEMVDKLRRKLPHLQQRVGECTQRQNGMKVYFQKLRHDIGSAIDGKIQSLQNRRHNLMTEVDVIEQERLTALGERQEKAELDTASAASFCDSTELDSIASATGLNNVRKQCEEILKRLDRQEQETQLNVRFDHDDRALNEAIHNYGRVNEQGRSTQPVTNNRHNSTVVNATVPRRNTQSNSQSSVYRPTPTPRNRLFDTSMGFLGLDDPFSQTFPNRRSPSNMSSLFGPYPSPRRRTDSPPIPTLAVPPPEPPRQQEAFSGFISMENPNFRRRRNNNTSNRNNSSNTEPRRRSHPAPSRATAPGGHPEPARPTVQRRGTFTRVEPDEDDDDIVVSGTPRRGISFQIPLEDPAPLPPRTPNSLEAARPVNNYQQKHVYRTIDTRRGQAWFTNCTGVTVASETDNLYFVDAAAHKILIFDTNGRHIKSFGSQGTNSGEFDKPFDCAFKNGILFVSDAGNNRVQTFNADGVMVPYQQHGYNFQWPQGVASNNESVFVCDSGHSRICVLEVGRVRCFQHAEVGKPTYIGATGNRVAVTDTDVHAVFLFGVDGNLLRRFGQEGSAVGNLLRPTGVVVDFQGFVLVANSSNYRIDVFRENGRYYCSFGERGQSEGQFNKLQGIAVASNGRVAICDGNKTEIF